MKRAIILVIFVLTFSLPTLAGTQEESDNNKLNVVIDSASAWSDDFNVTAFGLISVNALTENSEFYYHITIHNATNYLVISRYNNTGDTYFNFLWEGLFRVYVWNPGTEQIEIDLSLHADSLFETEDFGYSFDFDENRCLQATVFSYTDFILPINQLERGTYEIRISTFVDDGSLSFYLSKLSPVDDPEWKGSATKISWMEHMTGEFQVLEDYNWIVLSSEDGSSHTVTLVMIYYKDTSIKPQNLIIGVALIVAVLLLTTTQVTNRRKKKERKNYYSPKPSREDVQKQLHLVSQVDIRHEGGRYVYIPPDLTEPDLLDEGKAGEDETTKSK